MSWTPPRKYKGLRTQHVHAAKVTLPYPDDWRRRGLYALNPMIAEMEDWCEEFCTRNWSSTGYSTWYFDKTSEAIMFKLVFGGK